MNFSAKTFVAFLLSQFALAVMALCVAMCLISIHDSNWRAVFESIAIGVAGGILWMLTVIAEKLDKLTAPMHIETKKISARAPAATASESR